MTRYIRESFLSSYLPPLFIFILFFTSQLMSSTGWAEVQKEQSASVAWQGDSGFQSQMVVIDGRDLFRLVGIPSYPADKRVAKTVTRIKELARDPSFDPDTLTVKVKNELYTVWGAGQPVVRVTAEDVALEGNFSPEEFTNNIIKKQIERAIKRYRNDRSPETLKANAIKALLRTGVLVITLFLLFWGFKKFDILLERHFKRKIEDLESKSKHILKSKQIWNLLKFIIQLLRVLLVLLTIYVFLNFVLSLFPWTRFIAANLLNYTITPIRTLWQSFINYLPSLFFLVIIYLLFRYVLKLTWAFFDQIGRGQLNFSGFDTEWALPTFRIVRVFIIILGFVVAYPYIPGSGSEAFKGISIFAGILFSLGSSSLIANIIAGYTMTYRRAFKEGDRVKIGEHTGDVSHVRLMETHLKSLKNEEIVIPNSQVLSGEVTNYSSLGRSQGLILHTTVGIGYEVPWRQVKAMLLMAAERTDGLKRKPEPFVFAKTLGDFGVVYELNVFCRNVEKMVPIYSELHCNIQDVFNEYDIAIMTPHYVADTEQPKTVPKDQWYASPAQPPE